jgi:hypothetical protein
LPAELVTQPARHHRVEYVVFSYSHGVLKEQICK